MEVSTIEGGDQNTQDKRINFLRQTASLPAEFVPLD